MTRRTVEVDSLFSGNAVAQAVEAAAKAGLLCAECATKVATMATMGQDDFCAACQSVISQQLAIALQSRLQQSLADSGLPIASIQVVDTDD